MSHTPQWQCKRERSPKQQRPPRNKRWSPCSPWTGFTVVSILTMGVGEQRKHKGPRQFLINSIVYPFFKWHSNTKKKKKKRERKRHTREKKNKLQIKTKISLCKALLWVCRVWSLLKPGLWRRWLTCHHSPTTRSGVCTSRDNTKGITWDQGNYLQRFPRMCKVYGLPTEMLTFALTPQTL